MELENSAPLWKQLYDVIESRILDGTYPEGEILPGEMSFKEEFGVSRATVRQAMNQLLSNQMVSRQRGIGTIVLKKENIKTSFESSFNGVQEIYNTQNRKVVSVSFVKASLDVAYYFDIPVETDVFCLERETYVDGKLMSVHTTYINPKVKLDVEDDYSGSFYKKLESIGYKIDSIQEKITCSLLNSELKKRFGIKKSEAMMSRIRMGKSKGEPIEYTDAKYLGQGYELVVNLL